jgi:hypothetical protein
LWLLAAWSRLLDETFGQTVKSKGGQTFLVTGHFNNFECSWDRKFIPHMSQKFRGVEGLKIVLKISLQICEKSQEVLKIFFKNVIFLLKKSKFSSKMAF